MLECSPKKSSFESSFKTKTAASLNLFLSTPGTQRANQTPDTTPDVENKQ